MRNKFILKIVSLVFLMLIINCNIYPQSKRLTAELKNIIATADQAFEEHNYFGAARLYEEALSYNPRLYDIIWKAAEAYRIDNDYVKARYYYTILVDNAYKSFPEAIFYLGKMEKANEEYIRAQYYFNRYYQEHKDDKDNLLAIRAKNEIRSSEYAWSLLNNPTGEVIETFDTTVNTVYSEFAPGFMGDSILLFSSIRPISDTVKQFKSDIYQYRIGETFNASKIDTIINKAGYDVSNPFFTSTNGGKLFFSAAKENYQSESHIYVSYFEDNNWSVPKLLPEKINVKGYNSIQPFFVERENRTDLLLWASDRPEGEGGYDIWFCEVLPDGSYGLVRNIGRPLISPSQMFVPDTTSAINTPGNEISPFYCKRDSLLYFSSDWHKGMGGYDIFSVKVNFNTNEWGEIKNLGYPINSAQNDTYYKVYHDLGYAVFASNRKGSLSLTYQSCCNDLYYHLVDIEISEEEIIQQKIEYVSEKTELLVPIELYFDNDKPVPRSWDTTTDINYTESYKRYINKIDEFREWYAGGLKGEEKNAAIDSINSFFNNYVKENYKKLLEFSDLTKILLEEGQRVEVTIKGFTSPLNTAAYNINLSKRRISSLVNFFNEYNDGVFNEYIENGQLSLDFVAFGMSKADQDVSADPTDIRSSVYSPQASRERRIEIIAISIDENN